jgi:uncharacterized protein (DUF2147 family)
MQPKIREHRHITRFVLFCLLLISFDGLADGSDIEGFWLSGNGDGWIEMRIEGSTLSGTIVGSPNDIDGAPPRLDVENPDPALQTRKLLGLKLLQGFRYAGKERWTGGTVYDPTSGKTYKGTVTLIDHNTLKLRGYIGISLFGRNVIWSRVAPWPRIPGAI